MKKKEIGEYLYLFYRKRSASFLAHVYKASVTGDSKDIHRARLDVKRIFALYGLFEMLDPTIFKHHGGYKLFRPLYRQAGKIREIQVNYILLEKMQTQPDEYSSLIIWLRKEEHRAISLFLQMVRRFNEDDLSDMDNLIEATCNRSSIFKLRSKTIIYIRTMARKVKDIQLTDPGEDDIHEIRKTLKAMSTIATLVLSVKSGKWLDQVITSLNKTEMMIGDWHDQVVLRKSIERFLKENSDIPPTELNSLEILLQTTTGNSARLVEHFMPEVSAIVEFILAD